MFQLERRYWDSPDHPRHFVGISREHDEKGRDDQPNFHQPIERLFGDEDAMQTQDRMTMSNEANLRSQRGRDQYDRELSHVHNEAQDDSPPAYEPTPHDGEGFFDDKGQNRAFDSPAQHSVIDWDTVREQSPGKEGDYAPIDRNHPVGPTDRRSGGGVAERYANPDSSFRSVPLPAGGRGRSVQPPMSGYDRFSDFNTDRSMQQADPLLVTSAKHPLAPPATNQTRVSPQRASFNDMSGIGMGGGMPEVGVSPESDDPYDFFVDQEQKLLSYH